MPIRMVPLTGSVPPPHPRGPIRMRHNPLRSGPMLHGRTAESSAPEGHSSAVVLSTAVGGVCAAAGAGFGAATRPCAVPKAVYPFATGNPTSSRRVTALARVATSDARLPWVTSASVGSRMRDPGTHVVPEGGHPPAGSAQYSSGSRNVVAERSASVMIQNFVPFRSR